MALWNPNQVLDLYYGPMSRTCSGTTQKGLRCKQNMISGVDRIEAAALLDRISENRPETIQKEVYEELAYLTLCPRWHRDKPGYSQVAQVARQFQTRVQRFISQQAPTSQEPVRPQPQPQTSSNIQSSTSGGRRVLTSRTVSSTTSPSSQRLPLVQLPTSPAITPRSASVLNTLSHQDILDLTPEELEAFHRADAARRRLRDLNRTRNQSHQPQAHVQGPPRLVPLAAEAPVPPQSPPPAVPLPLPRSPNTPITASRIDHSPTEPRLASQQPQSQASQPPQRASQPRARPQVAVQAAPILAPRIQAAPTQVTPEQAVPVQAAPTRLAPVPPRPQAPVHERLQNVPQPHPVTLVQPPPPAPVADHLQTLPQPRPVTPSITTARAGPHPRKPLTDPCPICFDPLDLSDSVYCRGQCGTNVHRTCFSEWQQQCVNSWDAMYGGSYVDEMASAAEQRRPRREDCVTCIFCRGRWVEGGESEDQQG